ncbi:amidase [Nocardioides houyundeii]|uniref:amidase n=1 Tax=Nocardioides houyundeii TaxID=2045452 RepID=UPI000DF128A5|nr:amidase [Nocardioides houyundeii]
MSRLHAFADDALLDHDAVALVAMLRSGQVSVTELVEAAIARTSVVDQTLGTLAVELFDQARARARDPRGGFFSGIPTVIKDNADLAGVPTQHGTDAFVSPPAQADGDFARMFLDTGVIPIGKSRLSEFGFSGAVDHPRMGPVRSPWHHDHYAGASSAGSAALVAAGAVPLAHANDGGGSIRIPAAVNGLVGLKPTRDRVPQDKLSRSMPVRIVADGVLSRTVRDTAAFLRESERIYRNPRLAPVGDVTEPLRRPLRIAVVTEGVGRSSTPEVRELTLKTAARLEAMGHRVEHIDPPVPDSFADHFLLYWSMLSLFLVRTGKRTHGESWDPSKLDNLTLGLARHCERNLHKLPLATAVMAGSELVSRRHYAKYDVTLTPTLATATPLVGHLDPTRDYEEIIDRMMDWVAFTPLQNATGEPAVSLPLATTSQGLPQGMQLGAGRGQEALLLGLSYALEEAHPWPRIQD